MKITKLPSGKWHTTVYSHTDGSGKRKYKSITAPTKSACELKAAEFKANKTRRTFDDLTIRDCLTGYVDAKRGVLSPSTLREYDRAMKNDFASIQHQRVCKLTNEIMQQFVSEMSTKLSPKTVRNRYGFLRASVAFYYPELHFKVTFPAKEVKRPESPSDDVVRHIYEEASPRLKPCIALAMCGLRRGEIAAVQYEDIVGDLLHIHADMVQDSKNKWIYKEIPKTDGSDRFIRLPSAVLDLIGSGSGYIVRGLNPNSIGQAFGRLAHQLGYNIHLHQLRHYYASVGAILGVPDIYLADMGGWRHDSGVMKSIYQNKIKSMSDYYADKMNDHIDGIMQKKGEAK